MAMPAQLGSSASSDEGLRRAVILGVPAQPSVGAELDANGDHIVLGNETPDFVMGLNNRVQFGAFSLVAHIDIKQGGDIINS